MQCEKVQYKKTAILNSVTTTIATRNNAAVNSETMK